jgi:hypothetical protein
LVVYAASIIIPNIIHHCLVVRRHSV